MDCAAPFVLKDGVCTCSSHYVSQTECDTCPTGEYWAGQQCEICPDKCLTCESKTSVCTTCEAGYSVVGDICACEEGFVDSGSGCVDSSTLAACDSGFYNDGADNCVECGSGCTECTPILGKCETCELGWFVSATNDQVCLECTYPIGFPSRPDYCIEEPFNSMRVIPEYASDAAKVDWRDWGIFKRAKN